MESCKTCVEAVKLPLYAKCPTVFTIYAEGLAMQLWSSHNSIVKRGSKQCSQVAVASASATESGQQTVNLFIVSTMSA
eukprot:2345075-Amphidinium_carterae.1